MDFADRRAPRGFGRTAVGSHHRRRAESRDRCRQRFRADSVDQTLHLFAGRRFFYKSARGGVHAVAEVCELRALFVRIRRRPLGYVQRPTALGRGCRWKGAQGILGRGGARSDRRGARYSIPSGHGFGCIFAARSDLLCGSPVPARRTFQFEALQAPARSVSEVREFHFGRGGSAAGRSRRSLGGLVQGSVRYRCRPTQQRVC
ncbi:hypothetical protein DFJ74DRAFT_218054 [Hyaloraphidium curvatum]|nr:hypothetical protein DFJ74DRAFT_218054 [Hyaloraphidium curvatum]